MWRRSDFGLEHYHQHLVASVFDLTTKKRSFSSYLPGVEVEAQMQTALGDSMIVRGGTLSDLQLLDIKLPSMFDSSLTETERIRELFLIVAALLGWTNRRVLPIVEVCSLHERVNPER